jgi:hypothetical protein
MTSIAVMVNAPDYCSFDPDFFIGAEAYLNFWLSLLDTIRKAVENKKSLIASKRLSNNGQRHG